MSVLNRGGRRRRRRTSAADLLPDGECNSIFKSLPNEIKFDILSRLDFDLLLDCKLVCKSWCKTIQNPTFAKIHLRQQQQQQQIDDKVSFLFLNRIEKSKLYYGKNGENRESCMKIATVNLPLSKMRFVGSCNGLVCFSVPNTHNIHDPIYICNPSMGEQITLPRFTIMAKNKNNVEYKKTSGLNGHIVSGFGYDSGNDEYKVVRIYYGDQCGEYKVQVYTLGSGSGWRDIGECPYRLLSYSGNAFANGALHWLRSDWSIVSFDLKSEMFSLLPSPPCFPPDKHNFYILQVLDGCLCVVHDQSLICLNIWSFKKETSKWTKMFAISCDSNKFIDSEWPMRLDSSGKLILRYGHKALYSYDPQTGELKKLTNGNIECLSDVVPCNLIEAISHTNSFVTLRSLGERSKKIARARVVDVL